MPSVAIHEEILPCHKALRFSYLCADRGGSEVLPEERGAPCRENCIVHVTLHHRCAPFMRRTAASKRERSIGPRLQIISPQNARRATAPPLAARVAHAQHGGANAMAPPAIA